MAVPKPSQVTDSYWIWAGRENGSYPKSTERNGKWMIFIGSSDIDKSWTIIKEAIEQGLLGDTAKVSTARPSPIAHSSDEHVIIVYTYDGDDVADVERILRQLQALGFTHRIYWKSDEATLAGRYNIGGRGKRVSRYCSTDFD